MIIQCEIIADAKAMRIENDMSTDTKERVQIRIGENVNGKFVEKAWFFVNGNELIKAVQNAMNW